MVYSFHSLLSGWRVGLTRRRVSVFCAEGRIPGVTLIGKSYIIPDDAEKPINQRKEKREKKAAGQATSAEADHNKQNPNESGERK